MQLYIVKFKLDGRNYEVQILAKDKEAVLRSLRLEIPVKELTDAST